MNSLLMPLALILAAGVAPNGQNTNAVDPQIKAPTEWQTVAANLAKLPVELVTTDDSRIHGGTNTLTAVEIEKGNIAVVEGTVNVARLNQQRLPGGQLIGSLPGASSLAKDLQVGECLGGHRDEVTNCYQLQTGSPPIGLEGDVSIGGDTVLVAYGPNQLQLELVGDLVAVEKPDWCNYGYSGRAPILQQRSVLVPKTAVPLRL